MRLSLVVALLSIVFFPQANSRYRHVRDTEDKTEAIIPDEVEEITDESTTVAESDASVSSEMEEIEVEVGSTEKNEPNPEMTVTKEHKARCQKCVKINYKFNHEDFCMKCLDKGLIEKANKETVAIQCKKCQKRKFNERHEEFCKTDCITDTEGSEDNVNAMKDVGETGAEIEATTEKMSQDDVAEVMEETTLEMTTTEKMELITDDISEKNEETKKNNLKKRKNKNKKNRNKKNKTKKNKSKVENEPVEEEAETMDATDDKIEEQNQLGLLGNILKAIVVQNTWT